MSEYEFDFLSPTKNIKKFLELFFAKFRSTNKTFMHKVVKKCYKFIKYFSFKLAHGYQLKYIFIKRETDDIFAHFNKYVNEVELLRTQCLNKRLNNVFIRKISGSWAQLSGNYIVNKEIKDKIEKIIRSADKYLK